MLDSFAEITYSLTSCWIVARCFIGPSIEHKYLHQEYVFNTNNLSAEGTEGLAARIRESSLPVD